MRYYQSVNDDLIFCNFLFILKDELELIKSLSYASQNSNGTLWFGHFPTTTIHEPYKLRSAMT